MWKAKTCLRMKSPLSAMQPKLKRRVSQSGIDGFNELETNRGDCQWTKTVTETTDTASTTDTSADTHTLEPPKCTRIGGITDDKSGECHSAQTEAECLAVAGGGDCQWWKDYTDTSDTATTSASAEPGTIGTSFDDLNVEEEEEEEYEDDEALENTQLTLSTLDDDLFMNLAGAYEGAIGTVVSSNTESPAEVGTSSLNTDVMVSEITLVPFLNTDVRRLKKKLGRYLQAENNRALDSDVDTCQAKCTKKARRSLRSVLRKLSSQM